MSVFGRGVCNDIVLEKFVGNNFKEFKIIESELKKIIKIIKKNLVALKDRTELETGMDANIINKSDHVRLIEEMFKKVFGLKGFFLTWIVNPDPNARTYCNSFTILDTNFRKDETGHQTNNKLFVGVILNTGLVTYANLDEKELMAIILHEIGHNFYRSIFQILSRLPFYLKDMIPWQLMQFDVIPQLTEKLLNLGIYDIINLPAAMNVFIKYFYELVNQKFPDLMKVLATAQDVVYNITSLFMYNIVNKDDLVSIAKGETISISRTFKYNVEKHADSFAVDYGYGKEMASALNKMNLEENSMRGQVINIPILNFVYDLYDVQNEMIGRFFSGYPSDQNRIRTGLDRLKRSLNDPTLSPSTRKLLEKQIAEYDDYYYNVYLKLDENENKKKIFTWIYANMVETVFKGKMDLREFIYAIDPAKYT